MKPQETGEKNTSQRVSVFQRLHYPGSFQGRIGYYNQPKKEPSHLNIAQKTHEKKGKKLEQAVAPKIIDIPY